MFLNLVMLAGLGGAAVPLLLHLLARSRCRDVRWGAMMFLQDGRSSQTLRSRFRQWVLLAVRMLLVGLLAVALARPVVGAGWGLLGQEGGTLAVIVLDRSYSMAIEEAGQSRFDKAREAVLQVLSSLGKGDEAALVLLGERVEVREPTSNLQLVAREVAELQVSSGWADMAAGLAAARQLLDRPDRLRRELYVVCDRQAASWQGVGALPAQNAWMSGPGVRPRFSIIAVGGESAQTIAIEGVELVDTVAVRGQPAEVEVRLRNHGRQARPDIELKLSVSEPVSWAQRTRPADRDLRTLHVTVPGAGTAVVRVPVTFERTGSHVLSAELGIDGPRPDVHFDTAVDVIDPIQVLIVSGDEASEGLGRESFFLRLALAPRQTAQRQPGDPTIVTVRPDSQWDASALARYQVVILANVPQLSADQVRALEQRVYEGGGLIVCPGNLTRLDGYNSLLYADGQGLLPARLGAGVAADGSRATSLLGLELTHPIFRFRRGTDPLPSAVIGRYFPAVPRRPDAKVLATYASGEPFLIEGARGRGRVLLVTTPLDADWNTLPLYPFYLPFVQSMVRYACGPTVATRNLSICEPLIASFDQPLEEAQLIRADGRTSSLPTSARTAQVRFADTDIPGIYRLAVRARGFSQVLHFVVQAPRRESDPAALTVEQWAAYEHALGFHRLEADRQPLSDSLAAQRGGRELWLSLLACVLALGVGELWLARRWSGGPT